ncbi:MAG: transcriptional repressor LexA [Dehalococcoidia bacterium]|nr:transcriptional repressor LexA [Dehalococcoidia bacterium]MDW8120028.1 transcriptional repressor LexA [Chloroflexota bacterium]
MQGRRPLSPRQQRILTFIREFILEHGYPPSIRDIQKGCGLSSTSVVDYNLQILQREGYLRRSPEVSRGIDLIGGPGGRAVVPIPVLGTIAAGEPLPTFPEDAWQSAETLELPTSLVPTRGPLYALRVKGQSMLDALITDGDIILVQQVPQVENGAMAVVWLKGSGEVTLKHFYRERELVRLQPANSQMAPLYVHPKEVEVKGKVVGVLRFLG